MRTHSVVALVAFTLAAAALSGGSQALPARAPGREGRPEARPAPKPQTRQHGTRVAVDARAISVDDGDSIVIRWNERDHEIVRILGIDTPETRHVEHDIPFDQPFGPEARTFAEGAFAVATEVELLRASTVDPYDRTLGYLFLNRRNYSLLVLRAGLAEESVSRYGDNGFPREAAEVLAAAKEVGPLPFESPGSYRARMRDVARDMRAKGLLPPSGR
jgi:endonuclease YncB( thermonuclease family)